MKKMKAKKLALCRETVAHLEPRDLEQVQGGSIISSDNKDCTYTRLGPDTTCWC
ncbi:MAG TPA: class I lanthipeptide [Thermoanaerobaculia bacterium]|nr:class I lanthipeptide [Thermoanaerobaculia bacterium]